MTLTPFNLPPRCQATDNGHRCDLPAGHDYHEAYIEGVGTVSWRTPGPGQYSMPPGIEGARLDATQEELADVFGEFFGFGKRYKQQTAARQAAELAALFVEIRDTCGRIRALLGGDA